MVLLHFRVVEPTVHSETRLLALRRLAWASVLLMLVVTAASAWLRLAQPGPDCVDWPVCRASTPGGAGRLAAQPLPVSGAESTVRAIHRLTATLALLAVVAMVVLALRQRPRDPCVCTLTLALLSLALGLSALGIVTPGSRATTVLLGNMLGGLLMLALAWRLTRRLAGGVARSASRALGWWALAGAVLWCVQAGLGALSGSGASIRIAIAHQALALAPGLGALGVGWLARRAGLNAEGSALMAVAIAQWVAGATAVALDARIAAVLLHNTGAALGLALMVGLIGRGPPLEFSSRPGGGTVAAPPPRRPAPTARRVSGNAAHEA